MSTKADLSKALANTAGSTRRKIEEVAPVEQRPAAVAIAPPAKPNTHSAEKIAVITGRFPLKVRDQLKIMAVEQGKSLQDLLAESLNDFFAKHGKPEIAPAG